MSKNQMEIDREDVQVLLTALDAWERQSGSNAMISSMLGIALMKDSAKADSYVDEQVKKSEIETASRRERCIMLKAKLLIWRDQIEALDFSVSALR